MKTFFETRRAYHSTLRATWPVLARVGLTPSRFDALHAVLRTPDQMLHQSELRKALGIARSTVSHMVVSLQALGLIERLPPLHDRRQIRITLTPEGSRRAQRALRVLARTGLVEPAIDASCTPAPRPRPGLQTRAAHGSTASPGRRRVRAEPYAPSRS